MRRFMTAALAMILFFSVTAFAQGNPEGNKPRGNANANDKNDKAKNDGEKNDRNKNEKDDHEDDGPIQVGYAIVTPMSVTTSGGSASTGLVVFATFGHKRGEETTQAGIVPADLTTHSIMFVNTHETLSRNLGIGIVNANATPASITLTLRGEDGAVVGTPKTMTVPALHQTAQFITRIFGDRPEMPRDFTGSLRITSDLPVGMMGLRFRGANFSTIPITNVSPATTVPLRGTGIGGPGAVLLPHFAAGGGWATELIAVNAGANRIIARVDFFKQDGTPMTVRLNGQSKSSFTDLAIPAGGVLEMAPKDNHGRSRF